MSDEHDSWLQNAFGLDVGGAAQRLKDEAVSMAAQVQSGAAQVVQGVQEAAEGLIDGAIGAVTGAAKKVAGLAGGGGGGAPSSKGGGDTGGAGSFPLRGSVGRGGQNAAGDVRAVQRALGIGADGQCGQQTITAIEAFQRNQGLPKADGRVDPGGATERALSGGGGGAASSGSGAGGAPSVANDLGGAVAGQPALAEDEIPFIPGETALDVDDDAPEQDGGGTTPGPAGATGTISVRAKGDGSFIVTGSGFSRPDLAIRVVDDFLGERFFNVRAKDGKFSFATPPICVGAGPIHFSVLAGTHPAVSDLVSNFAHSTCSGPSKAEDKDKKEDKDEKEEPEDPDRKGELIATGVRTTYSIKVSYFIQDATTGKMLVNGEKFGPREVISFECESTGAPDTGRIVYTRDSTDAGNDRIDARVVLVSRDTITDLQV